MFYQGKNDKLLLERKWTDRQYHVQDNGDVAQQDVRMYCNTNHSQHYHFVVQIPNLIAQGG